MSRDHALAAATKTCRKQVSPWAAGVPLAHAGTRPPGDLVCHRRRLARPRPRASAGPLHCPLRFVSLEATLRRRIGSAHRSGVRVGASRRWRLLRARLVCLSLNFRVFVGSFSHGAALDSLRLFLGRFAWVYPAWICSDVRFQARFGLICSAVLVRFARAFAFDAFWFLLRSSRFVFPFRVRRAR